MDTAPQTARLVVRVLLVSCLIGGTLFGVSGRLDWAGAWLLLVVAASYSAATAVYFSRSDPDLLRERMSRPSNVPAWDRVIVWFYPPLIGSLFVTAALDARRRPGQSLPLAVQLLGGTGLIVTLAEGPTPSSATRWTARRSCSSARGSRAAKRLGRLSRVRDPGPLPTDPAHLVATATCAADAA